MTDTAKHNSGPWKVSGLEVQEESGWGIAVCVPNPKISGEAYATAKFIAAAPDMAEALKKMLAWHNGTNEKKYQPMQSIMEEACVALAKAGIE